MSSSAVRAAIADPSLRDALVAMIRRRVPTPEVEELVQATLTEALAARTCPDEPEEIRRWVHGIARHKVVDFHRRRRLLPVGPEVIDAVPAESAPHDAVDLLRWAEREMPETQGRTLDWMLREGEGEKLEQIAHEAALPAPQVRQRVARLRRHFRTRWAAQLAAAAALLGLAIAALVLLRRGDRDVKVTPKIEPDPIVQARALRSASLARCEAHEWDPCLKGLDEAAQLDPAGDSSADVKKAREAAAQAKLPPAPSVTPSVSVAPPPSVAPTPSVPPPKPIHNSKAGPKTEFE